MATKSVGLTGRDYSTMAAYASYVNALNFTAPEVVEVYNDGGAVADTGLVTLSGWTGGSATNTLTVRAGTGHSFRNNANAATNALRYNPANGAALTNSVKYTGKAYAFGAYVIVDGLQFAADGVGVMTLGLNSTVKNSIIRCASTGFGISTAAATVTVENCVIYGYNNIAGGINANHGGLVVTNTTIFGTGGSSPKGIQQTYTQSPLPLVKDTAVYGFVVDYQGSALAGSTNNATDKSTFGGTGYGTSGQISITSSEWVSITSGSEDFRLAAGSTKLKDNGATAGATTDIIGTARPQGSSYDIGAWEYAVAVGAALAATPTAVATATAALTTAIQLAATITAVATAMGDLVSSNISATAGSVAGATAALTTAIKLASAAASISSVTASLTTTPAVGFDTPALKNNTGQLLTSEVNVIVNIYNSTTGALVLRKTGLTSNSSTAIVQVRDITGALVASTNYTYEVVLAANGRRLPIATAS